MSSSASSAAVHIGRVGALAVALGIGAALATGTGTAWADSSRADAGAARGQTSEQSSSDSAASTTQRQNRTSPSARSTHRATADAGSDSAPPRAAATRRSTKPVSAAVSSSATSVEPQQNSAIAPAPVAPAAAIPAPPAVPAASASAVTLAPAATSPVPAPHATLAAPRLGARLLSALGRSALAGGAPGAPAESPALWALLAWARRNAQPASATVLTTPTSLTSTPIGWVTGQRNTAVPGALWTQTNNTRWANIYGTDLGIMWFNGVNGKTQLAFGDTFSGANMSGDWRSNVLLLSDDTTLTDGLSLINTGPAYQFIPAAPGEVFFIGSEVTNIPTSALYANDNNYVSYMSVKSWDTPGRWTTNYSAISQYDPNTDKWVLQKSTVRSAGWFRSSKSYTPGDQNFQQMAYVLEPESKVAEGATRYVYAFGTPSGRAGSAYLSRVPENAVTDLSQYEYWDGSNWVSKQAKATPVLGDGRRSGGIFGWAKDIANNPKFFGGWFAGFTGARTGGNVSEMSIQYNDYLDKYVVLYGNGANNVILRTADSPEGPWSDPITIATSVKYPGLYAPMIHPLSGTGQLTDGNGDPDINNLYWNMSIWSNYNVVLMQTDLSPLVVTPV